MITIYDVSIELLLNLKGLRRGECVFWYVASKTMGRVGMSPKCMIESIRIYHVTVFQCTLFHFNLSYSLWLPHFYVALLLPYLWKSFYFWWYWFIYTKTYFYVKYLYNKLLIYIHFPWSQFNQKQIWVAWIYLCIMTLDGTVFATISVTERQPSPPKVQN